MISAITFSLVALLSRFVNRHKHMLNCIAHVLLYYIYNIRPIFFLCAVQPRPNQFQINSSISRSSSAILLCTVTHRTTRLNRYYRGKTIIVGRIFTGISQTIRYCPSLVSIFHTHMSKTVHVLSILLPTKRPGSLQNMNLTKIKKCTNEGAA